MALLETTLARSGRQPSLPALSTQTVSAFFSFLQLLLGSLREARAGEGEQAGNHSRGDQEPAEGKRGVAHAGGMQCSTFDVGWGKISPNGWIRRSSLSRTGKQATIPLIESTLFQEGAAAQLSVVQLRVFRHTESD